MDLNLVICFAVAAFCGIANGLDANSAREQPCFTLTNLTVPLDLNWVGTIKTLYYPLMSRLELYRIAADLLQKDMNEIPENSLYYDSCMWWNIYTNGTIISRGFDGLSREYKTKLLNPNMEKFEFSPVTGKGYSGTVYTTMTDNKTFLFTPFCTNDGEMAWGLGSIYPTLPKETLQKVREHAISLGFKKEYFTGLRYDRCNIESEEVETATATEIDVVGFTTDSTTDNIDTTEINVNVSD